jgi:hypothetical protein
LWIDLRRSSKQTLWWERDGGRGGGGSREKAGRGRSVAGLMKGRVDGLLVGFFPHALTLHSDVHPIIGPEEREGGVSAALAAPVCSLRECLVKPGQGPDSASTRPSRNGAWRPLSARVSRGP